MATRRLSIEERFLGDDRSSLYARTRPFGDGGSPTLTILTPKRAAEHEKATERQALKIFRIEGAAVEWPFDEMIVEQEAG